MSDAEPLAAQLRALHARPRLAGGILARPKDGSSLTAKHTAEARRARCRA